MMCYTNRRLLGCKTPVADVSYFLICRFMSCLPWKRCHKFHAWSGYFFTCYVFMVM